MTIFRSKKWRKFTPELADFPVFFDLKNGEIVQNRAEFSIFFDLKNGENRSEVT